MGNQYHVASYDPDVTTSRYGAHSEGYKYFSLVDHTIGSVHIGKGISTLAPGGKVARHLHSYEEAFYVLEGRLRVSLGDRRHELVAGDYGFFPVETAHAWLNAGDTPGRWLEVAAAQPLPEDDPRRDTFFTKQQSDLETGVHRVDLGDPRNRFLGHWEGVAKLEAYAGEGAPIGMDVGVIQAAPGLYVKELVCKQLGAHLVQLIMCEFGPGTGMGATTHDHTYEESFFLLDGEIDGTFMREKMKLHAGDGFWVGVGTPHGWHNSGDTWVRWLESQVPIPQDRYSYRWTEQWEYMGEKIDQGLEPSD